MGRHKTTLGAVACVTCDLGLFMTLGPCSLFSSELGEKFFF